MLVSAALIAGCSEPIATPVGAERSAVVGSTVKFLDVGASASWNEEATSLAARRPVNVARLYAYLSLAQFRGAQAAGSITAHPPVSAAIGAASAEVLFSFFPADSAEILAVLAAQEAADPASKKDDFVAGEALGRTVGARVNAFALGDRAGLANPGTPPIGPGFWQWSGGPIVRGNYRARAFFLASDDEFRPGPPPAFGSPDYLRALAEVRQISDTRTAEQLAIAQYWNANQSGVSNAAMQGLAVQLIRAHHLGDLGAAKVLFLANASAFDALVGCFDAKYFYWFIRPPQADPGITLPIGLPPHPSYPSAHSCVSGAITGVLAAEFPGDAARVNRIAQTASLSRLYAGIHYRFDMVAGLALGRAVAAKAVAAELDGVAPLP